MRQQSRALRGLGLCIVSRDGKLPGNERGFPRGMAAASAVPKTELCLFLPPVPARVFARLANCGAALKKA